MKTYQCSNGHPNTYVTGTDECPMCHKRLSSRAEPLKFTEEEAKKAGIYIFGGKDV